MSSKRYPEEFKIEAVKQITERGMRWRRWLAGLVFPSIVCTHGSNATVYPEVKTGSVSHRGDSVSRKILESR